MTDIFQKAGEFAKAVDHGYCHGFNRRTLEALSEFLRGLAAMNGDDMLKELRGKLERAFGAGREDAAAESEARIVELERALLDAEAAGYAKGKTEAAELALSIGRAGGVEEAAAHLERLAKDYADEFGSNDMGGLSFGQGEHAQIKMDYYSGLLELADELRKLKDKAKGPADSLASATCTWKPHRDEHMPGTWESGCGGALWTFEHDGPVENGIKFCMSCGKPALVVKDE